MPVSVGYAFGWLCWTCLSVKSRSADWLAQTEVELFLKVLVRRDWSYTTPQPHCPFTALNENTVGINRICRIIFHHSAMSHVPAWYKDWKEIFLADNRIINYPWYPWLLDTADPLQTAENKKTAFVKLYESFLTLLSITSSDQFETHPVACPISLLFLFPLFKIKTLTLKMHMVLVWCELLAVSHLIIFPLFRWFSLNTVLLLGLSTKQDGKL